MDTTKHEYSNILTVICSPSDSPDKFSVIWRSGLHKQGTVLVTIPLNVQDKSAIAELSAMQYIIDVLGVMGNNPALTDTLFVFSNPVIKKLTNQKSDKIHLYPFAYFLTTRFSGVDVRIDNDASWVLPRSKKSIQEITVTEPMGQMATIPGYGNLLVTKGAYDQFKIQLNGLEPHETWKNFTNTLSSPTLKEVAEVRDGTTARLYDHVSKWCFLVGDSPGGKRAIIGASVLTRDPRL